MKACLQCHAPIPDPSPDLLPGMCRACTDRHEEISTLWIQITIAQARQMLGGTLPAKVREEISEMVKFYEET